MKKGAIYAVLVAAMGLMASCGTTKNTESGDTMESDTTMTQPIPDTSGTETPMPMDTMGQ
ncbi:hypothetical protein EDD80_11254 [Anseongella ginsenosidimutans]|uniref:Uncharacterized protein n=1 Tax=Anseongella ginsenosidimutans TaxID=496056 RepID=A0A4V2UTD5_9SPHI|nr:hypothetical protein EDD80_11254 [Anseongella ginsenosidimutans]